MAIIFICFPEKNIILPTLFRRIWSGGKKATLHDNILVHGTIVINFVANFIYKSVFHTGFLVRGGDDVSVLKQKLSSGIWGHAPPRNFLKL